MLMTTMMTTAMIMMIVMMIVMMVVMMVARSGRCYAPFREWQQVSLNIPGGRVNEGEWKTKWGARITFHHQISTTTTARYL